MQRFVRMGWLVAALCAGVLVAGCSSYYRVTDPQSGRMYYAEEIETISGGGVKVIDARTGSIVTLQNSEVKEIEEDEFKAAIAPVAPAPVIAPAPAPAAEATPAPAAEVAPVQVTETVAK